MNPALPFFDTRPFRKGGVKSRIKKLLEKLNYENLDGLIVFSRPNISYLTKFRSRDSYLIISKEENIYLTDSRYAEEARVSTKEGFRIEKIKDTIFKSIAESCLRFGLKRIGFEERYLSLTEYNKIKEAIPKKVQLIPARNLIEDLRQIKEQDELAKIKKAVEITARAFKFIKDSILVGRKEIEIAADLEYFVRYNGAYSSAFDIIVASGPNSGYPHHITSQKRIKKGEPVLIDMGVDYLGYKSDLTRVFFLDKITSTIRRTYDIVLEAQTRAIKKVRPGIVANKIDKAARQYISQKGYGGHFGHSLGHGVGLEVHEQPAISGKANNKLKAGMVFTIEPAIYLPSKFGGIRIEDMVLVTHNGCEVLSGSIHK